MIIFLFASVAFADEVDDKLGAMATERIRNSARQMIQNRFTERYMLEAHWIVQAAEKEQLPVDPVMARYYGIAAIETGVQITVMSIMVSIFLNLLTGGLHEKDVEQAYVRVNNQ